MKSICSPSWPFRNTDHEPPGYQLRHIVQTSARGVTSNAKIPINHRRSLANWEKAGYAAAACADGSASDGG